MEYPVTVSRRRWITTGGNAVPKTLRRLGITFLKRSGESFWEANRMILSELYQKLRHRSRDVYRELHPDRGGNAREFDGFVQAVIQAKKSFRHNIGSTKLAPVESDVLSIRLGGLNLRRGPTDNEVQKAYRIAGHLLNRVSLHKIKKEERCSFEFIQKVRVGMNKPIPPCDCGQPTYHRGWCSYKESQNPQRSQWRKKESNKALIEANREEIADHYRIYGRSIDEDLLHEYDTRHHKRVHKHRNVVERPGGLPLHSNHVD